VHKEGNLETKNKTGNYNWYKTKIKETPEESTLKTVFSSRSTSSEMSITTEKNWYNASYFKCKDCDTISWGRKHFGEHLVRHHKGGPTDNRRSKFSFEKASEYKEYKYSCKICRVEVWHERPAIGGHLKTKHSLTITEYEAEYEKGNFEKEFKVDLGEKSMHLK
jgi:hypothetical protein